MKLGVRSGADHALLQAGRLAGPTRLALSALSAVLLGWLCLAALAAPAQAGQWVQVSCENADGSGSSNQGWTATHSGSPGAGSWSSASCGKGKAMSVGLSTDAAAPVGAGEILEYKPPAGSTLIGADLHISGYGGGYGDDASADDVVMTPDLGYPSNVVWQCAQALTSCSTFSDSVNIPANQGGGIYIDAFCGGHSDAHCNEGAKNGVWMSISMSSAQLRLSNSSVPAASGFSGTVLGASVSGTASLNFTATDSDGPGVYRVTASVDGNQIYSATPNSNNGECASHGTYTGTSALEFDYAQPCPQSEAVTIPVDTTTLSNGSHELKVTVTDAASNTATVFDQDITTANATPAAPALPPAQLSLSPRLKVLSRKCASKRVKVHHRTVKRRVCRVTTGLGSPGTAVTRPGHPGHAYGLLRSAAGAPLGKVSVAVSEQVPDHGTRKLKAITTNAQGRFSLALKGPSGTYRFSYAGDGADGAVSAGQRVSATTTTTLAVAEPILAPGRFSVSGRIRGGDIPARGVLVQLYYRVVGQGRSWSPFGAPIRAAKSGRWRTSVPISAGSRGYTYQFRARVIAQPAWPYAGAASATVTRRIR